jgi:starch phosphorylase
MQAETNILYQKLPKRIGSLADLAYNLWWSWNLEARELFKVLDRSLWTATVHNPVQLLQQIPQSSLVSAAQNPEFLERYDLVMNKYHRAISSSSTWFTKTYPEMAQHKIAYFSLEFAIHNSLPIYAGGLGILAGDYCKEASDLGLPMTAIGYMYPQGYFHQHVDKNGWQEEIYEQLNFAESPISHVLMPDKTPLKVSVPLDDHSVFVSVWQVNIGRVILYLLDTNLEDNAPLDQKLSARLYIGDRETRLRQEIVIGIGGVRVLRALGIKPCIWHANEGHTSFMMLERVKELVTEGATFEEAVKKVQSCTIFTTHTPVPAGNDAFPMYLIDKYLHRFWETLNTSRDTFISLGTQDTDRNTFNMTVLSMNLSSQRNGVSQLHGQTCRRLWHGLWPDVKENEVPISYVTNGVHAPTWISPQASRLFDKYLGAEWRNMHDEPALWQKINNIPDHQIWEMRRWLKYKLIKTLEDRIRERWSETDLDPAQTVAMGSLMDTEILSLGFCRRATEYKRATLIFNDINRLKSILKNKQRPIQIIFSGKAHPDDVTGKYIIQEIYKLAADPDIEGRIAFVENYDMHMARYLVQGIDVWLSNPRWLEEASGTSGMKSCLNGGMQLSVLDGWWYEGFNGLNGWAIENTPPTSDRDSRNKEDADQIYRLLEEKIVPLYYERDINGVPLAWIQMIKESIRSIVPFFNTRRMMKEYTKSAYLAALASCDTAHNHILQDKQARDYSI